MYRIKIKEFFHKFDLLLLILAWPLIPMLVAEFFIGVSSETQVYFEVYYVTLWLVFAVEFALKLYIAKNKFLFLKANWLDVLVVLSPVFRSFKIFHILRMPILLVSDEVIKMVRSLKLNFLYFFIVTIVVILIAADVVLFFERHSPSANIKTFENAIWWGFVTFSTVGYGDFYPITLGGRVTAIFLMILGFSLFGILVSTAISFFMRKNGFGAKSIKTAEFITEVEEETKTDEIISRLERIEELLKRKDESK